MIPFIIHRHRHGISNDDLSSYKDNKGLLAKGESYIMASKCNHCTLKHQDVHDAIERNRASKKPSEWPKEDVRLFTEHFPFYIRNFCGNEVILCLKCAHKEQKKLVGRYPDDLFFFTRLAPYVEEQRHTLLIQWMEDYYMNKSAPEYGRVIEQFQKYGIFPEVCIFTEHVEGAHRGVSFMMPDVDADAEANKNFSEQDRCAAVAKVVYNTIAKYGFALDHKTVLDAVTKKLTHKDGKHLLLGIARFSSDSEAYFDCTPMPTWMKQMADSVPEEKVKAARESITVGKLSQQEHQKQ
jgi:hypothetical protein